MRLTMLNPSAYADELLHSDNASANLKHSVQRSATTLQVSSQEGENMIFSTQEPEQTKVLQQQLLNIKTGKSTMFDRSATEIGNQTEKGIII